MHESISTKIHKMLCLAIETFINIVFLIKLIYQCHYLRMTNLDTNYWTLHNEYQFKKKHEFLVRVDNTYFGRGILGRRQDVL